jgi:membrane-bound lytic murein transglycosylase B
MKFLSPLLLALAFGAGTLAHAAPVKQKPSKKKVVKAKRTMPVHKVNYVGEQVNFSEWKAVTDFADELALRHGFARAELGELIAKTHYINSAVQLVKPGPPGKPKNMNAVRALLIEPVRIDAGVKFWDEHAAALARAEAAYGVPAEIIVGIIGIETVYGRNTGRFRIVDVLTTLAFAYPDAPNKEARMAFFRGELENTLVLARKQNVDPFSLLGSFAGAIGWPQFMPGSVLAYGIDFDNDGVTDLRNSPVDAIGSVANFLLHHGWKPEENGPVVYAAQLESGRDIDNFIKQGLVANFDFSELAQGGVSIDSAPRLGRLYGLIDLQNGTDATEYWVSTNNFYAITQYNRSYFYAMSVIELGQAVRLARATTTVSATDSL